VEIGAAGFDELQTLNITDPFNSANQRSCGYLYDDLTRIGSVRLRFGVEPDPAETGEGGAAFFTYDPFGNINKSGSISFQPTYNQATNQYSSLPSGTPTYDANGNLLTDGFHTYSWDAENRMQHFEFDNSSWTFDALGRPVEKTWTSTPTQAVYGPLGRKLALMNGQAFQEARMPLVAGAMARYATGTTGPVSYWHPDWLGTSRLESTPSRTVAVDAGFAPFGEQYVYTSAFDSTFTGSASHDAAPDLWDFSAREYHPTQGRWISPDPAGLAAVDITDPQTLNRYVYVRNNPLGLTDPSGLCVIDGQEYQDPCYSTTGTANAEPSFDWLMSQLYFSWYYGALGFGSPRQGGGAPGTGGQPSTKPPAITPPKSPQCTSPETGIVVGATLGASAGFGLGPMYSAGGVLTGGAGGFYSPGSGGSVGAFASGGGFTSAYGSVGNAPANNSRVPNMAVGGFAGAGPGLFITNAGNTQSLSGKFTSFVLGLPAIPVGASGIVVPPVGVEFDYANRIGVLSASIGKSTGYPIGFMTLQTNTFWTSGLPPCQ